MSEINCVPLPLDTTHAYCQAPTQLQTQTPELELGPIFGFHHPPHHITFLNHKIQLKLATIGRDNMNKEAG